MRTIYNFILFLTMSVISFCEAESNGVSCEKVKLRHWGWVIDNLIITCFMDDTTVINNSDFVIESEQNENVQGFLLEHNQGIEFLPTNINEKFPNLIGLTAYDCELHSISKKNFQSLGKLKELHLSNNKLKTIYSNTFEDLVSLEVIFLGGNGLKQLNSEAFLGLSNLHLVSLIENYCIDKSYNHKSAVEVMNSELSKKCGFEEEEHTRKAPKNAALKIWAITLFVLLLVVCVCAGIYIKFFRPQGVRYF